MVIIVISACLCISFILTEAICLYRPGRDVKWSVSTGLVDTEGSCQKVEFSFRRNSYLLVTYPDSRNVT